MAANGCNLVSCCLQTAATVPTYFDVSPRDFRISHSSPCSLSNEYDILRHTKHNYLYFLAGTTEVAYTGGEELVVTYGTGETVTVRVRQGALSCLILLPASYRGEHRENVRGDCHSQGMSGGTLLPHPSTSLI